MSGLVLELGLELGLRVHFVQEMQREMSLAFPLFEGIPIHVGKIGRYAHSLGVITITA